MTTKEIADRLITLCSSGDFETAQSELFAEDAVSIEPYATDDFEKETKGLEAIKEKGRKWQEMVEETHEFSVSAPLVVTYSFAITLRMDVTMKQKGRMNMTELCVYTVKDDKIISEEFFV
ncbi:MAG: SnoaL-like domain-containing protein [Panacibacter sp.]